MVFAMPETESLIPPELNENSLINSTIAAFSVVYFEGTMRALFSMLFGASALIFLDEARLANSGLDIVDRYYRRTLLLILFGLIHAYLLLWPYDVLYAYGLFGLLLFPMRKLSARTLLICGFMLLLLGDLDFSTQQASSHVGTSVNKVDVMQGGDKSPLSYTKAVTDGQPAKAGIISVESNPNGYNETLEQSSGEESIEIMNAGGSIATYRSDYATIFNYQRKIVAEKQSITIYQDYIFDIGGMMLLGMALLKLGVLTGPLAPRVYLIFIIVGYVVGASLRFALTKSGAESGYLSNIPLGYNSGRVLITFGHIGLIGLLCSSVRLKFVVKLFASVGRMALTNYIMQTVISIFLFYGLGFALYAQLERFQIALICLGVWLFQITYSNVWLIWFKQGPLEWLWRSMIYGKLQSNRKSIEV